MVVDKQYTPQPWYKAHHTFSPTDLTEATKQTDI